jgi:hypothetical protein
VLSHWKQRPLSDVLAANGLTEATEEPFSNDGWSGARLTALRRGRDRFVLKRTSWATDWIARATSDQELREGFIAANRVLRDGPVVAPYLGAGANGEQLGLLMPDMSTELIAWERPRHEPAIGIGELERAVDGMASLHFTPWAEYSTGESWPWCPLTERLLLLTRPAATRYRAGGLEVGERFLAGWDCFDRLAESEASALIAQLSTDPAPLVDALGRLPAVGLHGDLKLANVALLDGERIGLIDWQMMLRGPVAVELGWFLVSNVAILPEGPESVLARYRQSAEWHSGRWGGGPDGPQGRTIDNVIADWGAQIDLTWIVGLLLRGWRKGLDAATGVELPSGASAVEDLEWWCRRAVEAARRWL